MEREEFKTIVKGLKAVYAQPGFIADADAFEVWFGMLGDLSYGQVSLAAREHMANSPYPPTIADIRKPCAGEAGALDVDDAWGMVLKAIRTYGYMREAEALESLPGLCRGVVRNMGWQNLCQSGNIMADRAFFRDAYRPKMETVRRGNTAPAGIGQEGGNRDFLEKLDKQIGEAAKALALGGGKDGDTGARGGHAGRLPG